MKVVNAEDNLREANGKTSNQFHCLDKANKLIGSTNLKSFSDSYEVVKQLDCHGFVLRVKCKQSQELRTAILSNINSDIRILKKHLDAFYQDKFFIESLKTSSLLKFIEIFIDEKTLINSTSKVYRVFENMDHLVFTGDCQKFYDIAQKTNFTEFSQNDLIQILFDCLELFKLFENYGMIPILQNSLFCYSAGTHKILIQNLIPAPIEKVDVHQIFDEEVFKTNKRGFTNKLEIQKSSCKTAESIGNGEVLQESAKKDTKTTKKRSEFKKSILPYKWSITMCYELAKMGTLNQHMTSDEILEFMEYDSVESKNEFGLKNRAQFKKLFEFFDEINSIEKTDLYFGAIDRVLSKMRKYLENYWHSFYSFCNHNIAILQKPLYKNASQVRFEFKKGSYDTPDVIDSTLKELKKNRKYSTLEFMFHDPGLSTKNINEVIESVTHTHTLKRFSVEVIDNQVMPETIESLVRILGHNKLEFLNISFKGWFK